MLFDADRPLIQRAVLLDGVLSLIAGVASLAAAEWLAVQFGVSMALILALALFMAGYGAAMSALAGRTTAGQAWLWGIVIGNGLWVIASIAVAFSDLITPTGPGLVILLGQAAIVLVITEVQYFGMRRPRAAALA
jgi:hypothetical protein